MNASIVSLILSVESRNVEHLIVWYREELVLSGCEETVAVVLSVVHFSIACDVSVTVICHRCTGHYVSVMVEEAVNIVLLTCVVCVQSL